VAFFLPLACAREAPEVERPIEVVVPMEAATLDPRYATRSLDVKLTRLAHAGLFGLDAETLAPYPLLAKSAEFETPTRLRVALRPEARFHSGAKVTAEDVCATLLAVRDPTLGSPHRAVVRAMGSCSAPTPDSVVIELAAPRATLLTDLELPILRHDQARAAPSAAGELDGLGPFRFSRVRSGEVTLEPKDTGIGTPAHVRVVVRTIRDENARALRLLAGRSDVAPNAISPTLLPALAGDERLRIAARVGANVTYLLFHNDRPPFDRAEVRRAVSDAIDRSLLVRSLLAGRAQPASSLLPPGHWAAPERATALPFAPERSRTTLEGLGPVTLVTGTDRLRVTVARAVAQMLQDVGLEVRVSPLDFGVMMHRLDAGDFELAILQMPELTEPNVLNWFFNLRSIPGEGGEGRNRARYRSEEATALLDHASEAPERDERRALYQRLAAVMSRDMPVAPLWHEDQVAVVSPRAASFELSAEGRWLRLAALK
jgi:peptide/nickel transport system substrate-binding protein